MQLNTLGNNGKVEETDKSGKEGGVEVGVEPQDIEHGHLQEIEVDMGRVLQDGEIEDIEADTSPYPEVRAVVPETDDPE